MTQDQLVRARRARWRQDGNALLTLDDAERWLRETPLCLYLPRHQHVPAPAPSFVEAVAGAADPAPGPERLSAAADMLARLVQSGAVIPLNLFGAPSGIVGEQPDFLATPEALPYLYAMQPERNPKKEPSTTGQSRVSPLAVETWKLLEREGALTVAELREKLGREVTEAATLRALGELWHAMRAVPIPAEHGAPAHWELLLTRHRRELNVGSTQSQTTALSILASFYLQSAVAASPEQIGIFLSPLASRSRIRDVVHGLSTTRQLQSFPLGGEEQLYVEGTLPEFPEDEVEAELSSAASAEDAGLEQNEPSVIEAAASGPSAARAGASAERGHAPRGATRRPSFGDRARRTGGDRERSFPRREGGTGRPQRRTGEAGSRPRFEKSDRRPARFDRPAAGAPESGEGAAAGSFAPRRERPAGGTGYRSERTGARPFAARPGGGRPRTGGAKPPFKRDGEKRPYRPAGEKRPPFVKDGEKRPFRPAGDRGPAGRGSAGAGGERRAWSPKAASGDRPARSPRPTGERRPFSGGGEKRPYRPASEKRPFVKDGEKRPFRPAGDRRSSEDGGAERRPYAARGPRKEFSKPGEGGASARFGSKPFARKPAGAGRPPAAGPGERKPYAARPAGDRKPYAARPAGERRPYGAGKPAGDRAAFRDRSGPRSGAGTGPRPGPRTGAPGGAGRPSFGDRKPFRKDAGGPGGPPRPFRKPEGGAARPARPFRKDAGAPGRPPREGGAGAAARPFRRTGPGGGAGAGRPAAGRPTGAAGGRPAGGPPRGGRPGGAPGGRPSFRPSGGRPSGRPGGPPRPGGTRPPARRPKREGDEG